MKVQIDLQTCKRTRKVLTAKVCDSCAIDMSQTFQWFTGIFIFFQWIMIVVDIYGDDEAFDYCAAMTTYS